MPTIIALDCSLSMTRTFSTENETFHDLAVKGIFEFLNYLSLNSRLEFVSLVIYSTQSEVLVPFTRDYETIRQRLKSIEHYDKSNIEGMLATVSSLLATNWGTQSFCQILVFTDCGIGFGMNSLKKITSNIKTLSHLKHESYPWLKFLNSSRLSFICIGSIVDTYFNEAVSLYENFLEACEQKGKCFKFKAEEAVNPSKFEEIKSFRLVRDLMERVCESNFKPFEAFLKCGEYLRLQCPILIWPQPTPYQSKDKLGRNQVQVINRKLDICGFLSLSDIGSPASLSRHLIVPKQSNEKHGPKGSNQPLNEFEKLENEIRIFYNNKPDEDEKSSNYDLNKESACVLLHGALKVENMAALVLLNDNWYGFIYSYADSKKKSSLMLNILPPGNKVVPWLGDFRYLGFSDESAASGENVNFPVKSEKRSYSQNCVVWIKSCGLQSDIQKLLRHSKKLPDKTLQFYKELNRIRRAALSLGFVELLETLANIFEREVLYLPMNSSPDCAIQLKHSALELRKTTNRDLKILIVAAPTKYNHL